MADDEEVRFKLLVKIENDERMLNPLILPTIFKNQLPKRCDSITVVDKRGRRYSTCVLDAGEGEVKLQYARWHAFVAENILIDGGINTLCFTPLSGTEFEVICFDSDGLQTSTDRRGMLIYSRYLFKATAETMLKEDIPFQLLEDLNEKSLRRPVTTAKVRGSQQHASEVSVMYEAYIDSRGYRSYRAVGFEGSQWFNFCVMNNIEEGFNVLVTNLRNGIFKVEVFNEKGVLVVQ